MYSKPWNLVCLFVCLGTKLITIKIFLWIISATYVYMKSRRYVHMFTAIYGVRKIDGIHGYFKNASDFILNLFKK